MYISILNYSNGTLVIINDTENVTKDMNDDVMDDVLYALGYKDSEISWMKTEEDPLEATSDYVTLNELCDEADEDVIAAINRQINVSAEEPETDNDNDGKEARNG